MSKRNKYRIKIDREKCTGCRSCARTPGGGMINYRGGRARVVGSGIVKDGAAMERECRGGAISREECPERGGVLDGVRVLANKMTGISKSPPREKGVEIFWSWLGSFLGITAVAYVNYRYVENTDLVMMIGSFGASAVLLYGAVKSPFSQPRNLIGGHVVSGLVGAAAYKLFPGSVVVAAAAAVSISIVAMHLTKTLHPPGGATALIAVIGSEKIHALGFTYALAPAGAGAALMLMIALVVNNLPAGRRYPEFWM